MRFREPTDAAFDLRNWPFYWITRTSDRYLSVLEGNLKESGLDIPSWRVLGQLHGTLSKSVGELADEAIIKRSTMARMIHRMEDEGLVETRVRPSDQRVTEVRLTAFGKRQRIVAQRQAFRAFARAFRGVSEGEIHRLNDTLRKVFANFESEDVKDRPQTRSKEE